MSLRDKILIPSKSVSFQTSPRQVVYLVRTKVCAFHTACRSKDTHYVWILIKCYNGNSNNCLNLPLHQVEINCASHQHTAEHTISSAGRTQAKAQKVKVKWITFNFWDTTVEKHDQNKSDSHWFCSSLQIVNFKNKSEWGWLAIRTSSEDVMIEWNKNEKFFHIFSRKFTFLKKRRVLYLDCL